MLLEHVPATAKRIVLGVLVAVPLVSAFTGALMLTPRTLALVVGIIGIGVFMASETVHSWKLAAIGGLLMMSGVLAWALRQ